MAKRLQITLSSDLDDSPADETLEFGLDGIRYEIDLTTAQADSLRQAVGYYVTYARPVRGPKTKFKRKSSGGKIVSVSFGDLPPDKVIRKWAQENHHPVSPTGKVGAETKALYRSAHNLYPATAAP